MIAAAQGPSAEKAAPLRAEASRHFVHAGQLAVSTGGAEFTTVVASCVSVCLWDRRTRRGGMNHFVLARAPRVPHIVPRRWTYGDLAVPDLVARLVQLGSRPGDLEAKIFGGANLFGGQSDLGWRNAAVAEALLRDLGLPVVARDLGGRRGRKLRFSTADGGILVWLL